MAIRRDLSPSTDAVIADLGRAIRQAGQGGATIPYGLKDMGTTGDAQFVDPGTGKRHSVRNLVSLVSELGEGLSTASRMNTVALTPPPASTTGYPKNALWTQVAERDGKRITAGVWQAVGDAWIPVSEDASRLVTGSIDVGLLDAVLLGARLVEAGAVVTPTDDQGRYARMDTGGFWIRQKNSADGTSETLARLGPSGDDNFLAIGQSVVAPDRIAANVVDAQTLLVNSRPISDLIEQSSRLVAYVERRHNTAWRQAPTALVEINMPFRKGRIYRIDASPVSGSINAAGQQWAMMQSDIQMKQIAGAPSGIDVTNTRSNAHVWVEGKQDRYFTIPGHSLYWDTRGWAEDQTWGVLLAVRDASPAGAATFATWGNVDVSAFLSVYDMGAVTHPDVLTWQWNEGTTVVPLTTRWWDAPHTDAATYWTRNNSWDSQYPGQVVSGSYNNSASTIREGLFTFGNVQAMTAGTVNSARVEFRCTHTYSSAGAYVDVWAFNHTGVPGTRPTNSTGLVASGVWVGKGRVSGVDIPGDKLGLIRAGQFNSFLLSPTGRVSTDWYCRFDAAWFKGSYTS